MKKPFAAPLGAALGDIVSPALAARGLGQVSLITHWPEIVGAEIARFARPAQLQWPPRGVKRDPDAQGASATLILRIDGAFALEAQHLTATILARVNAHLGWRCVDKIAFRQGPLPELKVARSRPSAPSAQAQTEASALSAGFEDEELRHSLSRLGARVIDSARGRR